MKSIDILYEDDDLLFVNKPHGMLLHQGLSTDEPVLLDHLQATHGGTIRVVHRLDRATSGVLCLAKTPAATKHINQAFADRNVAKQYLAIVSYGIDESGEINEPLSRQTRGKRKRRQNSPALKAQTLYTRISESASSQSALVALFPKTGRRHQLRRHLRHIGFPIWGDRHYGHARFNRQIRIDYRFHRLALHAHSLALPHPTTQDTISIHAPLPPELLDVLDKLSLSIDDLKRIYA